MPSEIFIESDEEEPLGKYPYQPYYHPYRSRPRRRLEWWGREEKKRNDKGPKIILYIWYVGKLRLSVVAKGILPSGGIAEFQHNVVIDSNDHTLSITRCLGRNRDLHVVELLYNWSSRLSDLADAVRFGRRYLGQIAVDARILFARLYKAEGENVSPRDFSVFFRTGPPE